MDKIIYALIINHYATLKEIRDDYSIDEVLDLYEALMIDIHNKNEAQTKYYDTMKERRRMNAS